MNQNEVEAYAKRNTAGGIGTLLEERLQAIDL